MAFPDFIFSLPTAIFFSFLVFFNFHFFSITSIIVCLNFKWGCIKRFCFCKKRPLSRETWQISRSALPEIEENYIQGYVDNIFERQKSKKDKKRKKLIADVHTLVKLAQNYSDICCLLDEREWIKLFEMSVWIKDNCN